MYVHTYMYIYINICVYTYIYTYIYTHTQTCIFGRGGITIFERHCSPLLVKSDLISKRY